MTQILKRILLVCLLAVAPVVTMAEEKGMDSGSHMAAAQDLLAAMQIDKTYDQTVEASVDMQIKQNPMIAPYKKVMLQFFSKYMSWESLKEDVAKIYTDEFTIKELKELTAFYETPTGKKAALRLPVLMNKGAQLGISRVQAHMGELQQMIQEESKHIADEKKAQTPVESQQK